MKEKDGIVVYTDSSFPTTPETRWSSCVLERPSLSTAESDVRGEGFRNVQDDEGPYTKTLYVDDLAAMGLVVMVTQLKLANMPSSTHSHQLGLERSAPSRRNHDCRPWDKAQRTEEVQSKGGKEEERQGGWPRGGREE